MYTIVVYSENEEVHEVYKQDSLFLTRSYLTREELINQLATVFKWERKTEIYIWNNGVLVLDNKAICSNCLEEYFKHEEDEYPENYIETQDLLISDISSIQDEAYKIYSESNAKRIEEANIRKQKIEAENQARIRAEKKALFERLKKELGE